MYLQVERKCDKLSRRDICKLKHFQTKRALVTNADVCNNIYFLVLAVEVWQLDRHHHNEDIDSSICIEDDKWYASHLADGFLANRKLDKFFLTGWHRFCILCKHRSVNTVCVSVSTIFHVSKVIYIVILSFISWNVIDL